MVARLKIYSYTKGIYIYSLQCLPHYPRSKSHKQVRETTFSQLNRLYDVLFHFMYNVRVLNDNLLHLIQTHTYIYTYVCIYLRHKQTCNLFASGFALEPRSEPYMYKFFDFIFFLLLSASCEYSSPQQQP